MADLFGHEAPPVAPGMVEIACELRAEMRDAIAIVIRDRSEIRLSNSREAWTWLPLSEVTGIQRGRGKSATVTIPNWLAKEKGLI
jgi:hypothetical protein